MKVLYRGMLADGRTFQNTRKSDKGPATFTLGENKIISGLENAVLHMRVGEKKTAELSPEDAFGDIRPEVVCVFLHVYALAHPLQPLDHLPMAILARSRWLRRAFLVLKCCTHAQHCIHAKWVC